MAVRHSFPATETTYILLSTSSYEFCCQTVHDSECGLYLVETLLPYNHAFLERKVTHPFPPKQLWWWIHKPTQKGGSARDAVLGCCSPGSIGRPVGFRRCVHSTAVAIAAGLRFSRKGQDQESVCERAVPAEAIRACVMPQPNLCDACLATLLRCRRLVATSCR